MRIRGTGIQDTFAEAFSMAATRLVLTARTPGWAREAALQMTGFATSVIGCKCEAGIERELSPGETPDGRPGVTVLLFAFGAEGVGKRVVERVGQCVLTCPTAACYDGLPAARARVEVGKQLRYFGDGFQISKLLGGRRYWRVPVMEGEFVVEETAGVTEDAVGGGNFLILAETAEAALQAAEAAVEAIRELPGVILPFPGGIVRSGSKVGSRRYGLKATTNDAYCPTLRAVTESELPEGVGSVLEIVIDGLSAEGVRAAMRAGIPAACGPGVVSIGAGNYGGKLGQHLFPLRETVGERAGGNG